MKLNPCQSLSSQPEKRYIQHPVRLQSGDEGLDNGRSVRQPATVGRYELTSCHLILAALKSLPSMKVIAVKNPINIDKLFSMASMGREKGSIPDRTTGAKPNWSRPTRVKVAGHRDRIGIRSRVLNHKFTVGAKKRPPQVTIRLDASQDERQHP